MRFNRLFTFGCSFTQYWRWPTWADALGRQAEHYENWGLCGSGNSYQLYSLMECHQRHNIGSGDTVMIMWSNTSREDRYVRGRWLEGGNIYWAAGSRLSENYVRDFADERGFLIRDLAVITAAKHFLNSAGCDWRFLSMVPLSQTNEFVDLGNNPNNLPSDDKDVRSLYSDTLACIMPSVFELVFYNDWRSRTNGIIGPNGEPRDFHPTPMEHLEYVDLILPGAIQNSTRAWMQSCENLARDGKLNWTEPNRARDRL